jgi:SAM-dependent methyltransferase
MKITTRKYWDDLWTSNSDSVMVDIDDADIHQWINHRFHQYFSKVLKGSVTRGQRLLELGCGGSIWLPYFAKEYDFKVTGLDYSEKGCALAESILQNEGISGKIVCADLFKPPEKMIAAYDVVITFGLVEHFRDTTACLDAMSKYLKNGGLLITFVPNMVGLNGWLQKKLNRRIYGLHIPLDSSGLISAYSDAGMSLLEGGYFLSFNSSVVNIGGSNKKSKAFKFKRLIFYFLYQLSKIIWILERFHFFLPETQFFSPYLVCAGRKLPRQVIKQD